VTWVLQKLFGYSHAEAEKLMMDVHTKGKAVVSTGARERMELDASQLHAYGLWATVDRA
jgi:ATP-dependent Clp protease adaptor protein ClpS